MKRWFKGRTFSVLHIFVISNLLLLMVPWLTFFYINIRLNQSMKITINDANHMVLEQFKSVLDLNFYEIKDAIQYLVNDDYVTRFSYKSEQFSDADHYDAVLLKQTFQKLKSTKNFISDFYVYFPSSDSVMSANRKLDSKLFYHTIYRYEGVAYEDFISLIQNTDAGYHFINAPAYSPDDTSKQYLTISKTLFSTVNYGSNPVVVFLIDRQKILDILDHLTDLSGADMSIRTNSGPLVESRTMESGDVAESYMVLKSEHFDIEYVLHESSTALTSVFDQTRNTIIVLSLLCFGISFVLVFMLAYINYKPLFLIIGRLKKDKNDGKTNEFTAIEKAFEKMRKNSEDMQSRLDSIQPEIVDQQLYQLLHFAHDDKPAINDSLMRLGIKGNERCFVVAQMYIYDPGMLKWQDEREKKLMGFVIGNIAEEMHAHYGQAIIGNIHEEKFHILLTIKNSVSKTDIANKLKNTLSNLVEFLNSYYKMKVFIALSDVITDGEGLATGQIQASKAMEFVNVNAESALIAYQDVAQTKLTPMYYTIEDEIKIINYVKSADKEKALRYIDSIITMNDERGTLNNAYALQSFAINIFSTACKIAQEADVNFTPAYGGSIRQLFEHTQKIEELSPFIYMIIEQLAEQIAGKRKNRNTDFIQKIDHIIAENFHDQNMNVAILADKVDMSPSYLSTLYKEQTGKNISDSIQQARIEAAKSLLKQTDMNIANISKATGYGSDVTFIRAFKKIEGITPGQYRQNSGS